MKVKELFSQLTGFERMLWLASMGLSVLAFCLSARDGAALVNLANSLIGATALIFIAKGYVAGQVLMVLFSIIYGILSYWQCYYGEMLTYMGMTLPIAVITGLEWLKHPYRDTREVEVAPVTGRHILIIALLTVPVTAGFGLLLWALNTAQLGVSILSVATSFFAASLTYLRSPYYAVGYAVNDLVLIVLWLAASMQDISCLPTLLCFIMFFFNDSYGFYSWRRMQRRQTAAA